MMTRITSEYRLARNFALASGGDVALGLILAYFVAPAWIGVAMGIAGGLAGAIVVVGYAMSRGGVKAAEATAAPIRAAVKQTSRMV